MIDFSFLISIAETQNVAPLPDILTRVMPISLWQKNRLYRSNSAYYFVRKVDNNSDRLAEIEVKG
jgi:hypothetical protein